MATKTKDRKGTEVLNVAFVWDMSGSMGRIQEATKQGTLEYLKDLRKDEKKLAKKQGLTASGKIPVFTRLSLTVFDTVFEPWVVNQPIADVDVKSLVARYHHRGGTALYDAIAHTITTTEKRMRDETREQEKVLVIIMTDGGENSSQEYARALDGAARINALIKSYEKKGNWTFVWLGAGLEAMAEARNVGIAPGNIGEYAATADSVAMASSALRGVTVSRRSDTRGQTISAYADAGLGQDFKDEDDESA